jgi:nucleotide-binding universal stress UspA family protein
MAETSDIAETAPITALLCTDGSELALEALRAGLAVLAPPGRIVVVSVAPPVDPTLVTGTGFAGGVMTLDDTEDLVIAQRDNAATVVAETIAALGLTDAEPLVETGDPAGVICDLAERLPAGVVVIGSNGHGGLRRAIMGSVSDHVVRQCPCPVVVHGR